jgi:beta-1,4-galactosyltransferase 1
VFNKAALMNVGFLEARKMAVFDCYVFHDVDMLAEDDRNMYTCQRDAPRHIGAYVNNFNYA